MYVLAFVGGFCVMSLELLGGRILAPYFGAEIYTWGSIITIFMLALSLGYLAGGALTLRAVSLQRFGLIFVVAAVCLSPLLATATTVMEWVFDRIEDPRFGSLVACVTLFSVPTFFLGMISPYAVRLLVDTTHRSGHVAGRLYFMSTLGSALGTLATSFYLVLWYTIDTIIVALCGVLLLCGLLAVVGGKALVRGEGTASA